MNVKPSAFNWNLSGWSFSAHFTTSTIFKIYPAPIVKSSKSSNHQIHCLLLLASFCASAQPCPNKKRATTAADEKTAGEIKADGAAMQKNQRQKGAKPERTASLQAKILKTRERADSNIKPDRRPG